MFKSARIKLTLSYVFTMMTITLAFSFFTYFGVVRNTNFALERFERRIENRYGSGPRFEHAPMHIPPALSQDAVNEVRNNTINLLVLVNLTILLGTAFLSYFLAGKTLKPIEQMVKKQKKFTQDAAHEIKTPLTSIKTQLEVFSRQKKFSQENTRNLIESVVEDIDSLTLLTNSLLKQSMYESNKHSKSNFEVLDLKDIAKKSATKIEPKAEEKNISITNNLESAKIMGNESALTELLLILLDNAVKFNRRNGKINIKTLTKDSMAVVTVSDTGIGIKKDDLERVFERFYKAENSRDKKISDGFGIGLSIAKEIVEEHKGKIAVTSTHNKGTEFELKFPTIKRHI